MSQLLRERAVGMLTAGMSSRAVGRELNVWRVESALWNFEWDGLGPETILLI